MSYKAPLTWAEFGNAAFTGEAAPFLGVNVAGTWYPVAVRSGPEAVVDHWANKNRKASGVTPQVHPSLGQFASERFDNTLPRPVMLVTGGEVCAELTISCVISAKTGVYLICSCDHDLLDEQAAAANRVLANVQREGTARFKLVRGPEVLLSKTG